MFDENSKELIKSAIQMEKDGIRFYHEAAEKISDSKGSKMFESVADDEKRHLEKLEAILTDEEKVALEDLTNDIDKRVKTIFSNIPDEIKERIESDPEEKDILQTAIRMEEEGIKFYSEKCAVLQGNAKFLCDTIVEEEKKHRDIFANTLQYLESNNDWNVEEEAWDFEG